MTFETVNMIIIAVNEESVKRTFSTIKENPKQNKNAHNYLEQGTLVGRGVPCDFNNNNFYAILTKLVYTV